MGPKPDGQLALIFDVILGTGARIGEALAIRVCDVDLSAPTGLTRVELSLEAPGTVVELRAGDTAAETAGGYPRLASGTSGADGSLVLTPPPGTRARYVLVWITGLPRVDGRFVAGVRELRLLQP